MLPDVETVCEASASGWREAAEDLRTLAWLHAAERGSATWCAMNRSGFPRGLSLAAGQAGRSMEAHLASLRRSLDGSDGPPDQAQSCADDALAADYADIYLTHGFQASPCESVWRDEEHLMLQGPTLALRALYRRHGLQVLDWRCMPDDHLAHQLTFIAHLLEQGDVAAAAEFMEAHLMTWLPAFASRVAQRARTGIYAGLAMLTLLCCECLHARLVHGAGRPVSCHAAD